MSNRTIIQYYDWYLPADGRHWQRTAEDAAHLKELGITDVWLPPAYKGQAGMLDAGYGVYDLYDLGEFYQKGSIPTKYGTKEEYIAAIEALHRQGIRVMADIVLNHRMGADETEKVKSDKYNADNRTELLKRNKLIEAWTKFKFPGRNGKYSSFRWNEKHFSSVNYDNKTGLEQVFLLYNHGFATKVSKEFGNYDFLMGADVDFANQDVVDELTRWGKWYIDTTKIDGFRLDALKHIRYDFFPKWLRTMRQHTGKEMFTVGEYWVNDAPFLERQLDNHQWTMAMFDVPLHYRMYCLSNGYEYEHNNGTKETVLLRTIMDHTLVDRNSKHAVTFVDNHDTSPEQSLKSWVAEWFKPLAYALILLWDRGTPCVFYGDLYGIDYYDFKPVKELPALLKARKDYAHGNATPYFNFDNVIGWTREGNMAVVMSTGDVGWKKMKLGKKGDKYYDILGNRQEIVEIKENGIGEFWCNGGSVSVWVPLKDETEKR